MMDPPLRMRLRACAGGHRGQRSKAHRVLLAASRGAGCHAGTQLPVIRWLCSEATDGLWGCIFRWQMNLADLEEHVSRISASSDALHPGGHRVSGHRSITSRQEAGGDRIYSGLAHDPRRRGAPWRLRPSAPPQAARVTSRIGDGVVRAPQSVDASRFVPAETGPAPQSRSEFRSVA